MLLIGPVGWALISLGRVRPNNLGTHAKSVNKLQSEAANGDGIASDAIVVFLDRIEHLVFGSDREKENVSNSFLNSVIPPIY